MFRWDASSCDAMNEALDLLQRLAGATDAHLYVKDEHCRFLYGNAAVARMLSTTPEAMVGQTDADFVDETAARPFREADHRVLATGQPETLRTRVVSMAVRCFLKIEKCRLLLGKGVWALPASPSSRPALMPSHKAGNPQRAN